MAIEVTEEMRHAVYAADCARLGHQFDTSNLIAGTDDVNPDDPRGVPMMVLRARDAAKLPHITCRRCEQVWVLVDEPGRTYDDAVAKLRARLGADAPADALKPRPRRGIEIPFGRGPAPHLAHTHP